MWQGVLDDFLRAYGLRQLSVDRRVWVKREPLGDLAVHDHVDDSRLTATSRAVRVNFHTAWAVRFGETITSTTLTEDFTGVNHHRVGANAVEISCKGVIRRMAALLDEFPITKWTSIECPLPEDCLRRLKLPPTDSNPLVPNRVPAAQRAVGAIGFAAMTGRPDGCFSYQLLTRCITPQTLTAYVCRLIGRVLRYLLDTVDMVLTIRTPPLTHRDDGTTGLGLFDTEVDSSHGNGPDGLSYGGFVLMSAGDHGGALYWKTLLPPTPADSTGFAELHMCTRAVKVTLAVRMLQRDLGIGVGPTVPTPLHTDAQAILDGTGCERMQLLSRWASVRLAVVRWGTQCGEIAPAKRASALMVSNILTKPVTGALFREGRARILGMLPARREEPGAEE